MKEKLLLWLLLIVRSGAFRQALCKSLYEVIIQLVQSEFAKLNNYQMGICFEEYATIGDFFLQKETKYAFRGGPGKTCKHLS